MEACSREVEPCYGECDLCGGQGNQNTGCFTYALDSTACVMPTVADTLISTAPYFIPEFTDVVVQYEEELLVWEEQE